MDFSVPKSAQELGRYPIKNRITLKKRKNHFLVFDTSLCYSKRKSCVERCKTVQSNVMRMGRTDEKTNYTFCAPVVAYDSRSFSFTEYDWLCK